MSLAQHLIQDLIDEMFMNKNICKKQTKKKNWTLEAP